MIRHWRAIEYMVCYKIGKKIGFACNVMRNVACFDFVSSVSLKVGRLENLVIYVHVYICIGIICIYILICIRIHMYVCIYIYILDLMFYSFLFLCLFLCISRHTSLISSLVIFLLSVNSF